MKRYLTRMDGFQRRHPWAAFPFAVVKKFSEDQAGNLAALIAYYAFFSIFPLLLVFFAAIGFVLQGNQELQDKVVNSAVAQFPVFGDQIGKSVGSLHGSVVGLVIGGALALWSGLAVANTGQTAFNTVYTVPMADRPSMLPKLARSVGLIVVVGSGLVVTTLVQGFITGAGSYGVDLGVGLRILGAVIAIVLNTALFALAFRWLTVAKVSWRDALPGAAIAAAGWYLLQTVGGLLIAHKLKGAQSTYGQFALVIGMLSWFYLQAQLTLLAAEVNVVRQRRLWPRAMVDPPDTEADHRAYEAYAEREQRVDDEEVDTSYPPASRRRR